MAIRALTPQSVRLRRELEEELFGRAEVDGATGRRTAALMHPSRLSEPMRWLIDNDALDAECTGFGMNLVSGNCEFACTVTVADPCFWAKFGGYLEANSEADDLLMQSDGHFDVVDALVGNESWGNEGFSLSLIAERLIASGVRLANDLAGKSAGS